MYGSKCSIHVERERVGVLGMGFPSLGIFGLGIACIE